MQLDAQGLNAIKSRKQVLRAIRKGHAKTCQSHLLFRAVERIISLCTSKLHSLLNKLGRLYYKHCRTPLVITSLTRPINEQPRNGSKRSVHPAGIAADLRVPPYACRKWLRNTLLSWESQGLIEATREKRPPHFHIVVIPHRLNKVRLAQLNGFKPKKRRVQAKSSKYRKGRQYSRKKISSRLSASRRKYRVLKTYRVRRGDSIWRLSRRWHVSEKAIKRVNGLKSSHIELGQLLKIPTRS